MRRTTPTSTGRSIPRACSATRTGSSRWRAPSTGISRRSSGATRSAASGATGPASSTSPGPVARRRPGHDDRQPRRARALAPGRRLRAMPPDRAISASCGWTVATQDFRPGIAVPSRSGRCWKRPGARPEDRFVGQVEQMHESRCFRDSRGRLGCISCHDPHRLPAPEEKVAYYRRRCLECHADRGCRLPPAIRLARSREDDCIGCHMPRVERLRDPPCRHDESSCPPPRGRSLYPLDSQTEPETRISTAHDFPSIPDGRPGACRGQT